MNQKTKLNVLTLVKVAVLAALGTVLMFFPKITLAFFAPWLDLDLGNVPGLIGAFALGPVAGISIELIRNLLHMLLGTTTGGVGELSNFLVAVALLLTAALIYQHKKSLKNAVIGLAIGVVTAAAAACLTNYYIILPMFFGGGDINAGLAGAIGNKVNGFFTYMIYALIPFNLIKGGVNALVVGFLYKKLRKFI